MKRIKLSDTKWFMLLLLICVPIISSCSKEDLPAYEEAEITKVGAYHRFYSGDKDAITGENIVAEKELDRTNNIDTAPAKLLFLAFWSKRSLSFL